MNSVKHETIIDLLRWRAINQPTQRAYTFLVDAEQSGFYAFAIDKQAVQFNGRISHLKRFRLEGSAAPSRSR
jgi:hypothetical protein